MGLTRINRRKKTNKKSRKNKIGGTPKKVSKIKKWTDNVTFGKPPEGSPVFEGFDKKTKERNDEEFKKLMEEKEKQEKKEKKEAKGKKSKKHSSKRSPKRSPKRSTLVIN